MEDGRGGSRFCRGGLADVKRRPYAADTFKDLGNSAETVTLRCLANLAGLCHESEQSNLAPYRLEQLVLHPECTVGPCWHPLDVVLTVHGHTHAHTRTHISLSHTHTHTPTHPPTHPRTHARARMRAHARARARARARPCTQLLHPHRPQEPPRTPRTLGTHVLHARHAPTSRTELSSLAQLETASDGVFLQFSRWIAARMYESC